VRSGLEAFVPHEGRDGIEEELVDDESEIVAVH
jgi:hypothetical protein